MTMKPETWTSLGLLVLRLGVGVLMLVGHGWGKLMGFSGLADSFANPLGIGSQATLVMAVLAEVVCSLLLVLGLGTRVAAALPLAAMAVAAFVVHAGDPWAKKELALLYAVPYLALLLAGGGRFAVERVVKIQLKG
jgi:putative oxidoreductase